MCVLHVVNHLIALVFVGGEREREREREIERERDRAREIERGERER